MSYVYGVYQLEKLRVAVDPNTMKNIFSYLEDRAVQKDKNDVWRCMRFAFDNIFKNFLQGLASKQVGLVA